MQQGRSPIRLRLPRSPDLRGQLQSWFWLLLLSVVAIRMLGQAGVPVAMLIGPMLASTFFGLSGSPARLDKNVFRLAQGVTGCLVAQNLTPEIATRLAALWPVALLSAGVILVAAAAAGLAFSRWTGTDLRESLWGFLPGMAGSVVALASAKGVAPQSVAVIQVVRLVCVVLLLAGLAQVLHDGDAAPPPRDAGAGSALLAVAIASTGLAAGRLLPRMSAMSTIVPLLAGAAIQASGWAQIALPSWLVTAAFVCIGADIGLKVTPAVLRRAAGVMGPLLATVAALIAICCGTGLLIARATGAAMLPSVLALMPGSIDSVAIIAMETGVDLPFVITIQVLRLFVVLLLGPLVVEILVKRANG